MLVDDVFCSCIPPRMLIKMTKIIEDNLDAVDIMTTSILNVNKKFHETINDFVFREI